MDLASLGQQITEKIVIVNLLSFTLQSYRVDNSTFILNNNYLQRWTDVYRYLKTTCSTDIELQIV